MTTFNPLHLLALPPLSIDPKPLPTSLAFDPYSDLLWVGSSSGHVTALCSPLSLARNVQFPAHGASAAGAFLAPGNSPAVREIQVNDREVWTLTEGVIGGRRRGGAPRWSVGDPLRGLSSMCQNPLNSHEVVAGGMGQIILANTAKGELVRRYESRGAIVKIAPVPSQRLVLSATTTGSLGLLDPRTGYKPALRMEQVTAHSGGLSGADVQGNVVCTWGWTHHSGHPFPDQNVKLYDVRTLRALPPVSFPLGPAFCMLDPSSASRLIVASQQGSLQVVDLTTGSQSEHQQLDVSSYLTAMALSPRGDYLAFGDADGQLHLWTAHETGDSAPTRGDGNLDLPPFNGYDGVKPDWPDPVAPPPPIQWDETTPLSVVGMPYYDAPLLSNFPAADYAPASSPFFNPAPPIPKSVLDTMRMVDFVGRATLPPELKGKRNVVTARPGAAKYATSKGFVMQRKESGPKFRSEQERRRKSQELLGRSGMVEEEDVDGEVPRRYRRVEIKYSRFGVEDFDFAFYNHTDYSGLETHIINSYTNPLLQTLHYSAPIRAIAKAHICVDCKKENCLLCEAGFLFRMLEDARGINCQASNFSRAFSATPQAAALGLIDETNGNAPSYTSMIQNLNRWLLSTFSAESVVADVEDVRVKRRDVADLVLADKGSESMIDQILGLPMRTTNTCANCGHTTQRETTLHTIDLIYPKEAGPDTAFTELLQSGVMRETTTRATCVNCKMFASLNSKRNISRGGESSLPSVLSVNAMATTAEQRLVWQDQLVNKEMRFFLPTTIDIGVTSDGSVSVSSNQKIMQKGVRYALRSVICQIQSSADHPPHLVSFVKMPFSPTTNDEDEVDGEPMWILFNDFLVCPVAQSEVLSFSALWKTPAVVVYERQDVASTLDLSRLPSRLDHDVLLRDVSTAWNRKRSMIKHKVLEATELPDHNSLVSIDAEFVELQREETEFKSDGTKKVLRPSQMSLARVSVLRGEGEEEAKPFIDDYIHTSEPVVDYLTEYSGIKNGDLDPNNSPHTLVHLKVAYKKLRLLVDLGCSFVGHGLAKDFRTINIFVPPSQIMDTVHLFALPGRSRKLSLRFLVWYLLKEDIQTGMHDSIEDARCAWLLYRLWKQLQEEGRFDEVMQDVSDEGAKLGYKPPNDRVPSPAPPSHLSLASGMTPAPSPGPPAPQHGPLLNLPPPHGPSSSPHWRRQEGRDGPAQHMAGNGRHRGRRHH